MKYLLTILFFIVSFSAFSQDCKKCEVEPLQVLSNNIDSLTFEVVEDFICTLDSTCSNNIEYSEWSNELIFKIIIKDINLLQKVLYQLGYNYVELVAKEIESPVAEVDYKQIFSIIKNSKGAKDMKAEHKMSIINAARKSNIVIEYEF